MAEEPGEPVKLIKDQKIKCDAYGQPCKLRATVIVVVDGREYPWCDECLQRFLADFPERLN